MENNRIARSGFTAPTPVTVVGEERLEQRDITNVGEALTELPSLRALVAPATQQVAGGNIGATAPRRSRPARRAARTRCTSIPSVAI